MTLPLVTEYSDSSLRLAYAGPLVFMNWRTEFTPSLLTRVEALHHRRVAHYPSGVLGVNVVEPTCALPSQEARERANDMMKRTGPTTRAVVMVMLEQGFAASALQSIALRVLGLGGRVPIRSFRDVESAADWVHFQFPDTPDERMFTALVAELRGGAG